MKNRKPKLKKGAWFIRIRGSYLPCSWQGWLTYIPYTAYLVGVLWYVCASDFAVAEKLFIVAPNWVAAVAVMNWVAARKS